MRREGRQHGFVKTNVLLPPPFNPKPKSRVLNREGRQHGFVRTSILLPPPFNPKPKPRVLNLLDVPPTNGVCTKVPSKPTNHSKFTGRCSKPMCASCRLWPPCKSKDKSKGNRNLKSSAMDSGEKIWFTGASATRVLDCLYGDDWAIESDGDVEYVSDDDDDDDGLDQEKNMVWMEESWLGFVSDDDELDQENNRAWMEESWLGFVSDDDGLDQEKNRAWMEESWLGFMNDDEGMGLSGVRAAMEKDDDVDGDWFLVGKYEC